MRILIAPDKFRGTATAPQVASAVAAGAADAGHDARIMPLADGGEGTLDAFGGPNRWATVHDPAGAPVRAGWRLTEDSTAVVEMAQASGLELAGGAAGNDPWAASTRGTGELIRAAGDAGARRVIVGLGGSATTDGGLGALQVLLDDPRWDPRLAGERTELLVCCDVQTRFAGAAEVFGPQKGADPAMVSALRERLLELQQRYLRDFGVDVSSIPGGGAAGGLAGGLAAIGGRLVPGFDVIADIAGLDHALAEADLVITGEGQLDAGSFDGKVVGGVINRARTCGVPVIAVVGAASVAPPPDVVVLSLVDRFGRDCALAETQHCLRVVIHEYLSANPDAQKPR